MPTCPAVLQTVLSKDDGRVTVTINATWDGTSAWPVCDGPIVDVTLRNQSQSEYVATFPSGRAAKTRVLLPGVRRVFTGAQLTTVGLLTVSDAVNWTLLAPLELLSFDDAGPADDRPAQLPDATQARLVAVPVAAGDLLPGDEVGPADVTRASTFTVVAIPDRTEAEIVAHRHGSDIQLSFQRRTRAGVVSIAYAPANANVYVRRYESVIKVVHVDGDGVETVDEQTHRVLLRPTGDGSLFTIVNAEEFFNGLELEPTDRLVLTAPEG